MWADILAYGTYVILGLAAAAAFLLFVAGRAIGGKLDDGKPPAGGAPPSAGKQVGQWINGLGDDLQRAMASVLIVLGMIVAGIAGIRWNRSDADALVFILAVMTAGWMAFYLCASEVQKKARGMLVSSVLTATWIGFVLINVFIGNNPKWFPVRLHAIQIEQVEEKAIPTPNGTFLSVPELFGEMWETYLTTNKMGIEPDLSLNLETRVYEMRWNEEGKRYEIRAKRMLPRFTLARGE